MVTALLGTKPEIQVEGCRILDDIPTLTVPSWFIDRVCRIKPGHVSVEEISNNFISVPHFCFNASYHSLDATVGPGKANRHCSAESAGHIVVAFDAEAWDA